MAGSRTRALVIGVATVAALVVWPRTGDAHGIWGHVHVTGWAIENLPAGELRDFFADPEVMNAALFGAAFTDTGYGPKTSIEAQARAYSEHTHWEPFIQDFILWIRENDPPPWTDLESRKRVAFLMGCAAHGMQDEIFDSLFLYQVQEHDNGSQESADPGTDGFLALEGHLRLFPEEYIPMETVLELYEVLDQEVTEAVIREAVDLVKGVYVNEQTGPIVARALGETYGPELPWTKAHYLDPEIPGSLRAEINPTLHYLEAIWERLHDRFEPDDALIHTYPAPPRRLLGTNASSPDSWVTTIYGAGVHNDSAAATWTEHTEPTSADGPPVPFERQGTRWGATWTRLHRFVPTTALTSGAWYTLSLAPGVELIGGGETTAPLELIFQAPCAAPDPAVCPDLGPIPVPAIDGSAPPPPPEPEPEPEPEPSQADAPVEGAELEPDLATASPAATDDTAGCATSPHAPSGALPALLLLVLLLVALINPARSEPTSA